MSLGPSPMQHSSANMGPPMTSMPPPMTNMGPPMTSRPPPMTNMGPPMTSMGPPPMTDMTGMTSPMKPVGPPMPMASQMGGQYAPNVSRPQMNAVANPPIT